MKFLKTWAVCMGVLFIFFFFGGHMLFELKCHPAIALTVIAIILTVLVRVLLSMSDRIDALEAEVKELKKQALTSESEDILS